MTRALEILLAESPAKVLIADVSGRVQRLPDGAGTEPGALTLRMLWEREAPTRSGSDARVSFVETPAMQALSGRVVDAATFVVTAADGKRVDVRRRAAPVRDDAGAIVGVVVWEEGAIGEMGVGGLPVPAVSASASGGADGLPVSADSASASGGDAARVAELEKRLAEYDARLEALVEDRAREQIALQEARSHDKRLAAVGQLAAGVMHDVNNALNPIMAAAYLLRHHAESPDAVRDYAERIRMAAETGAATASRVGRFIRQEPVHSGGDEVIDLSEIALEVIDLTEPMRLRRSSGSNAVSLHRELEERVMTRGLPGEIREALLNLVQNAIDAMPDGGTLTVRTFAEGVDACIAIQDSGIGMSADTVAHAFEPFFTTKGSGGSGLGLAEVYGIARRHRGTATIESEEGAGSAITIRLPRVQASVSVAEPAAQAAKSPPRHVLVVEDHDDGREFLRRLLRTEGHDVDVASSCAEARERLAAAGSWPYHLMLTDVGLPDGSGWDLAAFARDHMPELRVGVITGWEPMVSSAEARGAEFVLRKPLRAAELLAHIAGRKSPAPPE